MPSSRPKRSRRRRALFAFILALIGCVAVESASYTVAHLLWQRNVIYRPRTTDRFNKYEKHRHPTRGWPASPDVDADDVDTSPLRDATGSRNVPAFPDPAKHSARIALYGDSFTWGAEVSAEHAWGNVLSMLLGERVANYGVGGYGSDQALMVFLERAEDPAEIVFLNHLSENILRNINRYRPLLAVGASAFAIKPRFILDASGELELIPLPEFSEAEFLVMIDDPRGRLSSEYFIPDGPSGVQYWSLPFTWTVVKSTRHHRVKAYVTGEPYYIEFYDRDHPAQGVSITVKIFQKFQNESLSRGLVPVMTIIPTGISLMHYRDHQRWSYQPLIDAMAEQQMEVLNFGAEIMTRLGPGGVDALFDDISGHFNEAGYRLLAEITRDHLVEKGLAEPASAGGK